MEELVQLILKTYGIAGVIMLSPLVAVVVLWRTLQKTVKDSQDKINSINEQRVSEAKAISDKLMVLVSEQSALNKETNLALERVDDVLSITSLQQRK